MRDRDYNSKAWALKGEDPERSWKEIDGILNQEKGAINEVLLDMKMSKGSIVYEDRKSEPTPEIVNAYYSAVKDATKKLKEITTKQVEASIYIDDDKPIGIAFTGDWHEGSIGVEYELLDRDRKLLRETEGLYVIGTGDYKENQSPYVHADGVNEQIVAPGMQDYLVINHVSELRNKWLAMVCGCHDYWDMKVGNKDFIANLCSENVGDCVNLWHGGGINIKIGNQEYRIWVRHKYLGESKLNTTNTQRRMVTELGPANVVAVAHKHFPDLQVHPIMGQETVFLRSGSYKKWDEFGQRLGGFKGIPGVPIVIFYPNKDKVVPIADLDEGIKHLKLVRAEAAKEQAEKARAEAAKARRLQIATEREERKKAKKEQAEREKAEREQAKREQAERAKAEREIAKKEKAERDWAEREQAKKEKAEKQKAEKEIAKKEKAERQKAEREQTKTENIEKEEN